MAYDDTAVTNLLNSIDANTPTVSNTLGALRRFREILYPDLADRNSLFLNIFGTPEFIPRRGLEATVAADLATVKTQLDAAIAGLSSVLSARSIVVPFTGTLISGSSSTAATGAATVAKVAGLTASANTTATGAATVAKKIAIAAAASTSSTGAAVVSSGAAIQPSEMSSIGGSAFTLTKNWDFGTGALIGNMTQLEAEFSGHDIYGTIANGVNYGSLAHAISVTDAIGGLDPSLGLPGNNQPVDTTGRYRQFTSNSILLHVKPLSDAQSTVGPASNHDAGDGSLMAKFSYPGGGSHLSKDIVLEYRFRVVNCPHNGYWAAPGWLVGERWDGGSEIDTLEAFSSFDESGTVDGVGFHSNSVGGTDERFDYSESWFRGLEDSLSPESEWTITDWKTVTLIYKADNSYKVFMDGYTFQIGTITWEVPQGADVGYAPRIYFLWDMRFGHVGVFPLNTVVLPTSAFPFSMEIDYARVFERTP